MRNILFVAFVFALSFSGRVCAGNPVYSDKSLRNDAEKLLMEWVDTLLTYQCEGLHPALDGGFLCPGCICRSTAVFCVPPVPAFTDG